MTTVSVITPNYNYGLYIEDAIQSVINQTVKPDEYAVVDDCSTDGSVGVIKAIEGNFEFIRNEQNLGIVENFRLCVERTTSDYVCFIGADNCVDPTYIQKLKSVLDANPKAAVAYSDIVIFGPLSKDLATRVGATEIESAPGDRRYYWKFPEPTDEALKNLENENFINGSAMFRRSVYDEVGGYRKTGSPEDADLFLRMIQRGHTAAYVPEALLFYRQHSAEQANTVLIHQSEIRGLQEALQQSQAWSEKLHSELIASQEWSQKLHGELIASKEWSAKLQTDIDELRGYVQKLESDNTAMHKARYG